MFKKIFWALGVVCPGAIYVYMTVILKTSSSPKPLGQSKPNFFSPWGGCLSPGSNWCFSFAPELVGYSAPRDLHRRTAYSICESLFLIQQDVYRDLFVCS